MAQANAFEQATFGAGCFWGVEYIFEDIEGVKDAVSGYAGGNIENPTYQQVLTKVTGHAEVVQLTFDPKKITYEKILEVYFRMHDPTQTDGQGPDIGPQYRSVIMYHNNDQKIQAENFIQKLTVGKYFDKPIVTKVEALKTFYKAEDYHQNYYEQKGSKPYCHILRPSFKL
ncbi:MAG: peptide-methionine (S)-S-oxide reductase MsrA [Bacteriovoracaceae bacterium]|nr:peptide-methionine (S)-S-oxide reductase MsrA [Bacteriovoracaceae bacterium]